VAFEEKLAERLRELLADEEGVVEKKMFGGLGFMLNGNMAVAASGSGGLLVRVDPEEADALFARPHASSMEMRGRPITGWLRVEPKGLKTKRQVEGWVKRGVAYAKTLPPK
jgi:TfoX/Sxy family transcriptional regulator of competence genes